MIIYQSIYNVRAYPVGHPAGVRRRDPCRHRLLYFYTFYATYTTYTLIFCAIIQNKKILKKPIDTRKKV